MTTDREEYKESRRGEIILGGLHRQQSVYKYVSLSGKQSWNYFEKTFQDFELIGSTIASLNDPFEGRPRLVDDLTDDKIEECLHFFDKSGSRIDSRTVNNDVPEKSKIAGDTKGSIEELLQSVRILSFCMRSDSPLLWSHYANSHRGVCIHMSLVAFEDPSHIRGLVGYARSRPVVPLSLGAKILYAADCDQHPDDRLALRSEMFQKCFFTKPLDWSYEEEARIIYLAGSQTNVKFNPSGLYEVILGANCDPEDAARVRNIVGRSSANVIIREAFIDTDTFSVGIK